MERLDSGTGHQQTHTCRVVSPGSRREMTCLRSWIFPWGLAALAAALASWRSWLSLAFSMSASVTESSQTSWESVADF